MHSPIEHTKVDQLQVKVYADRAAMGMEAAIYTAQLMREAMEQKGHIRMVFAAAPSQNELLEHLSQAPDLDWSRVTAFHMDEYVGLPEHHPARFVSYLNQHLFDLVSPGVVHRMEPTEQPEAECDRYGRLIGADPIDIVCLGIGENGHIAFNDPGVADFHDEYVVKPVELDEACRMQQVHDGCFADLAAVPTVAMTLTIPTLMAARQMVCVVPGASKSAAIRRTLTGAIAQDCPASILRTHSDCVLFVDSAAYGVR